MFASAPFASEVRDRVCRNEDELRKRGHECRRFEVPTRSVARSLRNFKSKSGTRTICLLVPLSLPKFVTECAAGRTSEAGARVPPICTVECEKWGVNGCG